MKKRSLISVSAGDIYSICNALDIKYRDGGAMYHLEAGRKDRIMLCDGYDDRILISPEGFYFHTVSPVHFRLFSLEKHEAVMKVLNDLDFDLSYFDGVLATRKSMPDELMYLLSALPLYPEEKRPYEESGIVVETRDLPYFKEILDEPMRR
ncbi:MAG: hypothetical protein R3B39_02100 [Candidatus Paceibacterota bacterium]